RCFLHCLISKIVHVSATHGIGEVNHRCQRREDDHDNPRQDGKSQGNKEPIHTGSDLSVIDASAYADLVVIIIAVVPIIVPVVIVIVVIIPVVVPVVVPIVVPVVIVPILVGQWNLRSDVGR